MAVVGFTVGRAHTGAAARRGRRKDDHRRGGKKAQIPFLGSDAAEEAEGRRIATAAAGGEQKGKSRRGDESLIQGGGSISGVQGVRFRRRMGQRDSERSRRQRGAVRVQAASAASLWRRRRR
ncbi:hypothetical protein [Oryza sativa Japonica Group]|uniref:Uncharacterized protein n=1 Tax=Oryza sativa subsp. japonica TaxID=39947 RepID=Q5VQK7_ORYSJ|nr:hypothetical protein [Oryza sativa Japonica Group]